MDVRTYDKLPAGTRVVKTWNEEEIHGKIVKDWGYTSRSTYQYSRFLADGAKRSENTFYGLITIEK
jgi:hypothetical protein